MNESAYEALISGHKRGLIPSLSRAGLSVLSYLYGRAIAVRNAYYDTWAMPIWLDVPVISVGNLTVGGTGKTPMTVWLCERMLERGRKPAVLSRGYKADEQGLADELMLIGRRVPQAVAIAHPDRSRAGRLAIEKYNVQAAILDDGFQHRRLGRDLDLVLVDATRPFGYGHILPRGLLRERISSIRRADAVVITRYDQADAAEVDAIAKEVHTWNREAPIVRSIHEPTEFADLAGNPVGRPTCKRAACLAGIARPQAFRRTLIDLGITPVADAFYPDHYVYSPEDAANLAEWVRQGGVDCLLTTEKDAVKLSRLKADWPMPVISVGIRLRMLEDGEKVLCDLIDSMLADHDKPKEVTTDGRKTEE